MFRQLSGVSSLSAYCKLICSIMWTIALIGFYVVHHRSASFDRFSNWNRYLTVQYRPIRCQFIVWRILSCTTRSNNVSLFQNLHSIGTGFSGGTNMVDPFKLHFTFDCWHRRVWINLCFDTTWFVWLLRYTPVVRLGHFPDHMTVADSCQFNFTVLPASPYVFLQS